MSRIIVSSKALIQFIEQATDLTLVYEDRILRMGSSAIHVHCDGKPFQVDMTITQANRLLKIVKSIQEQPVVLEVGENIILHSVAI